MSLATLLSDLKQDDRALWAYLDKLETRLATVEPHVHAFVPEVGRFERLRREAQALLVRYPDPTERPPFFGLLLGVKDIFHVDGLPTRAGSQLPLDVLAGEESAVVTAMRQAGALVLGKTVTAEFAYFAPGPTRNPHNLAHTPGGSSSGSAAAVAANLCPVALGTQTIGSVNRPAAFCGVVGFKPTHGRVSTAGVIPVSQTWDHVGFFVREAVDLATILAVSVPAWQADDGREEIDRPLILGIPEGPYLDHVEPVGRVHLSDVAEQLQAQGHVIKRLAVMPDFAELQRQHLLVMAGEMARVHKDWFEQFGERYQERTAVLIKQGQAYSEEQITQAAQSQANLAQRLQHTMDEAGLDMWLAPSAPGSAPHGIKSTGNPIMNLPWTHAGLPTLTLPTGRDPKTGLPLGTQFVARRGMDERLVAWGGTLVNTVPTG